MINAPTLATAVALSLTGLAFTSGLGCEKRTVSPTPAPANTAATPAPATTPAPAGTATPAAGARTYTVRGRVESLPSADGRRDLRVSHEAIADFVNRRGEQVGMKAMTMEFGPMAEGVSATGLAEGQPVEITFEMNWANRPAMRVTRITPLPADATLELTHQLPEGAEPAPK